MSTNGLLSKREREVMELVTQGLNHKNIAVCLSIRPETVRRHLGNIYAKLNVHNKIAAIQKMRNA